MRRYYVESVERYKYRVYYFVTAVSEKEAVAKCKRGEVSYSDKDFLEGSDEWISTEKVSSLGTVEPYTPEVDIE